MFSPLVQHTFLDYPLFNDAHQTECSLLGVYGPLGRRSLLHVAVSATLKRHSCQRTHRDVPCNCSLLLVIVANWYMHCLAGAISFAYITDIFQTKAV